MVYAVTHNRTSVIHIYVMKGLRISLESSSRGCVYGNIDNSHVIDTKSKPDTSKLGFVPNKSPAFDSYHCYHSGTVVTTCCLGQK